MRALAVLLVLLFAVPPAAGAVRVSDALCVAQSDGPFLALPADVREAYLAALADAGWTLLRTDFTWSRIEPSPARAISRSASSGIVIFSALAISRRRSSIFAVAIVRKSNC